MQIKADLEELSSEGVKFPAKDVPLTVDFDLSNIIGKVTEFEVKVDSIQCKAKIEDEEWQEKIKDGSTKFRAGYTKTSDGLDIKSVTVLDDLAEKEIMSYEIKSFKIDELSCDEVKFFTINEQALGIRLDSFGNIEIWELGEEELK